MNIALLAPLCRCHCQASCTGDCSGALDFLIPICEPGKAKAETACSSPPPLRPAPPPPVVEDYNHSMDPVTLPPAMFSEAPSNTTWAPVPGQVSSEQCLAELLALGDEDHACQRLVAGDILEVGPRPLPLNPEPPPGTAVPLLFPCVPAFNEADSTPPNIHPTPLHPSCCRAARLWTIF